MRIDLLKHESESTTITAANWVQRIAFGLVFVNGISAYFLAAHPEEFKKYLAGPVTGLNAAAGVFGIPNSDRIKKGRRKSGDLYGSPGGGLIVPDTVQELNEIKASVAAVKEIGESPTNLPHAFQQAKSKLQAKTKQLEELRQRFSEAPTLPPSEMDESDLSLFEIAEREGRVIDAVYSS